MQLKFALVEVEGQNEKLKLAYLCKLPGNMLYIASFHRLNSIIHRRPKTKCHQGL
jgi:hypothetical protein